MLLFNPVFQQGPHGVNYFLPPTVANGHVDAHSGMVSGRFFIRRKTVGESLGKDIAVAHHTKPRV